MNLNFIFPKQKELDNHIYKKHNITKEDVFYKKTWAFISELVECMDEFDGLYKYWKENTKMDKEKGLEEYVDIQHFAHSLAIDCGLDQFTYVRTQSDDIIKLCIGITNNAAVLSVTKDKEQARSLLNSVIQLGYQLGFTEDDVLDAYEDKNKTNYNRQKSGY